MSELQIQKLHLSYGALQVLRDINLTIGDGEMHILLGTSGCGKTTLLRSIAGLAQPSSGTIMLAGRDIGRLAPKDREIGMVFQHYALFPNMTVWQNLAFGLEQLKWSKARIQDKVDGLLDTVSLSDRAHMRPHQLSGGQKQRVALARALALEPKLLLLDEPLSALDAQIRKRLREELKRTQREIGLTSVLVTHDQDEALSLGDRISVMDGGQIAQTGTGSEIFYRPSNMFVAQFMGDANIIEPADFNRITGRSIDRTVIVQPHSLSINGTGEIRVECDVSDVSIAGSVVRYTLNAHDVKLRADVQTSRDSTFLAQGARTTVSLQERDLHFL